MVIGNHISTIIIYLFYTFNTIYSSTVFLKLLFIWLKLPSVAVNCTGGQAFEKFGDQLFDNSGEDCIVPSSGKYNNNF